VVLFEMNELIYLIRDLGVRVTPAANFDFELIADFELMG
jgi:hypothetical protein